MRRLSSDAATMIKSGSKMRECIGSYTKDAAGEIESFAMFFLEPIYDKESTPNTLDIVCDC